MRMEDPVIAPQSGAIVVGAAEPVTDAEAIAASATEAAAAVAAAGLPPRFSCFVTGTDTEIGKTLVSSALLYALTRTGVRACGMKPVAAGAELRDGALHNDDADQLIAAGNVTMLASLTTPYMFREAAAPHIAAALEGRTIEAVPILAAYLEIAAATDAVVVEGVGGFCVPLNAQFDTADLAQQLDLPVIVVVGLRLGCINHALLTVEAVRARGLHVAGWVANTLDSDMPFADDNVAALNDRIGAPLLGRIPRLPPLAQPALAAAAAEYLDCTDLPNWPVHRTNTD